MVFKYFNFFQHDNNAVGVKCCGFASPHLHRCILLHCLDIHQDICHKWDQLRYRRNRPRESTGLTHTSLCSCSWCHLQHTRMDTGHKLGQILCRYKWSLKVKRNIKRIIESF